MNYIERYVKNLIKESLFYKYNNTDEKTTRWGGVITVDRGVITVSTIYGINLAIIFFVYYVFICYCFIVEGEKVPLNYQRDVLRKVLKINKSICYASVV